jgi:hypothetical protein
VWDLFSQTEMIAAKVAKKERKGRRSKREPQINADAHG